MIGQGIYVVERNTPIARDVYEMTLLGGTSCLQRPGQFVNILLDGFYLRRPISVCAWEEGRMTLVYKTVGRGTEKMAGMAPGEKLDLLTGLGNGFDTAPAKGKRVVLIGGGTGVPPLYALCRALGGHAACVLGFAGAADVFYEKEFRDTGAEVTVATADGSYGTKGLVTGAFRAGDYDYCFACGPEPMLRAVRDTGMDGQLSFEARMGCGFGACMGCSCQTVTGSKRICVEGPVLLCREVLP